jgi:predicted Zn-dependent peptidase
MRIELAASAPDAGAAGIDALALDLAARGSVDMAPDEMARAIKAASARLSLLVDEGGGPSLELDCPADSLYSLVDLLGRSFAAPAFRPEDFDKSLMALRVEERRQHSNRMKLARLELDTALRGERWLASRPLGSASALASLTLDDVVRHWKEDVDGRRLRIAAVGDIDADALAARLSRPEGRALGSLPESALPSAARAAPSSAAHSTSPEVQTVGLSIPRPSPLILVRGVPGSSGWAVASGEFDAPPISSPDFAALRVAMTMLHDLLSRELRKSGAIDEELRIELGAAGTSAGSLEIYGPGEVASVLDAVARSVKTLSSGRCVDPLSRDGALVGLSSALHYYRARGLVDFYAPFASSASMADELSRLSDAGVESAEFFKTANRIAAVRGEDVLRVATEYLAQAETSWIALGDPDLLATLAAKAVSRH